MEDSYGEIGMDVNAGHNDFFERALRPNAVKDLTNNWNDLVGYVYCVSKSFNPYSDHTNKKLNKEPEKDPIFKMWRWKPVTTGNESSDDEL